MNFLVRRYARETAWFYSLVRGRDEYAPTSFRLPSLAELGYVAGLAVMLTWAKGEKA